MFKKILAVVLASVAVFAVASCSQDEVQAGASSAGTENVSAVSEDGVVDYEAGLSTASYDGNN